MVVLRRWLGLFLSGLLLSSATHAEYQLGARHRVQNDLIDFDAVELRIDGKPVGFVAEGSRPVEFSSRFLAFAACRIDRSTRKPVDDYCTEWSVYDFISKATQPLKLPGLKSTSVPSFSWPYIAYVRVPERITQKNLQEGRVEVSCVVVEWPSKKTLAQKVVRVSVGHFETDAPGSFLAPQVTLDHNSLQVNCLEERTGSAGNVIATLRIPR